MYPDLSSPVFSLEFKTPLLQRRHRRVFSVSPQPGLEPFLPPHSARSRTLPPLPRQQTRLSAMMISSNPLFPSVLVTFGPSNPPCSVFRKCPLRKLIVLDLRHLEKAGPTPFDLFSSFPQAYFDISRFFRLFNPGRYSVPRVSRRCFRLSTRLRIMGIPIPSLSTYRSTRKGLFLKSFS